VTGINQKTGEIMYGKPSCGMADAMQEILFSKLPQYVDDPYNQQLRQRIVKYNISRKAFMRFIRWLYSQFSDKAAHEMS